MKKSNLKNTKARIVSAAWKLFYEQGYDDTTVDDIIYEAETSKGSFYHYFDGKDSLLSSLSYLFDDKYKELIPELEGFDNCFEKLLFLNKELFSMIENTVSIDLLARLLSSQLITAGEKHLLDHNRTYYKLLFSIVLKGQTDKEIKEEYSVNDIVKAYALFERAVMYDWCLCGGEYSLSKYSNEMLKLFLNGFKA